MNSFYLYNLQYFDLGIKIRYFSLTNYIKKSEIKLSVVNSFVFELKLTSFK